MLFNNIQLNNDKCKKYIINNNFLKFLFMFKVKLKD